jgi:hypothetical protein
MEMQAPGSLLCLRSKPASRRTTWVLVVRKAVAGTRDSSACVAACLASIQGTRLWPLSQTGAELLSRSSASVMNAALPSSRRICRSSKWTSVFQCQRLTCALLDRLTQHVHILELNGESYGSSNRRHDGGVRPNPPTRPPGYETPAISAGAAVVRRAQCPCRKMACFCSAPTAGIYSAVDKNAPRPRSATPSVISGPEVFPPAKDAV